MIWSTEPENPARAANATMRTRPMSSVVFAPMREDRKLVKNIIPPVMNR